MCVCMYVLACPKYRQHGRKGWLPSRFRLRFSFVAVAFWLWFIAGCVSVCVCVSASVCVSVCLSFVFVTDILVCCLPASPLALCLYARLSFTRSNSRSNSTSVVWLICSSFQFEMALVLFPQSPQQLHMYWPVCVCGGLCLRCVCVNWQHFKDASKQWAQTLWG